MRSSAAIAPASPIIRRATLDDLPACANIINDYVDETPWLPRTKSREEIEGFFTAELLEKRAVWLAEMDGDVVGYMSSAGGFVYALYLAPRARGLGIGPALIARARAASPQRIELTVFEPNLEARRFYAREGFVEVPEGRKEDIDEGVPTLLMRWTGQI